MAGWVQLPWAATLFGSFSASRKSRRAIILRQCTGLCLLVGTSYKAYHNNVYFKKNLRFSFKATLGFVGLFVLASPDTRRPVSISKLPSTIIQQRTKMLHTRPQRPKLALYVICTQCLPSGCSFLVSWRALPQVAERERD